MSGKKGLRERKKGWVGFRDSNIKGKEGERDGRKGRRRRKRKYDSGIQQHEWKEGLKGEEEGMGWLHGQ